MHRGYSIAIPILIGLVIVVSLWLFPEWSQTLQGLVLLAIAAVIGVVSLVAAWRQATEKLREEPEPLPPPPVTPSVSTSIPQDKELRTISLSTNAVPNHGSIGSIEKWISLDVTNNDSEKIECCCVAREIYIDGIYNEEFTRHMSEHNPYMSWSGGGGKWKIIESKKTSRVNVAIPTPKGMKFETCGGKWGDCVYGTYRVNLTIEGETKKSIMSPVIYAYVEFKYYKCDRIESSGNVISRELESIILREGRPIYDCIELIGGGSYDNPQKQ